MAKHKAYPMVVASIFFNFAANSANCLEKDGAIFSKGTSFNSEVQHLSSEMDVDITSPYHTPPSTPTKRPKVKETDSSSESLDKLKAILSKYVEFSDADENTRLAELRAYFNYNFPNHVVDFACDDADLPKSIDQHRNEWVKNNTNDQPQTKEQWIQCFIDSLKLSTYRALVFDNKSGNCHLFLKGNTPKKDTPRRNSNVSRLDQGKAPIYVDPTTDQALKYHMHHIGQAPTSTLVVQIPTALHQDRSMHANDGRDTLINRSQFETEKRKTRKNLAPLYEGLIV